MTKNQCQILDQYFHAYSEKLVQHAYRRTGDLHLSEDLVQKTFVQACRYADVVYDHPNPLAWLLKVLRHITDRELQKSYREMEQSTEEIEREGYEQRFLPLKDDIPKDLQGKDADLFLLHYEHNLSYREIAEKQGILEATCRKRVSRFTVKYRKLFEKDK